MKFSLLVMFVGSWLSYFAVAAEPRFDPFAALDATLLDATTFAESLEGQEAPIPAEAAKGGPGSVVWTKTIKPEFRGLKYGEGRSAGTRQLRIGFTKSLPVGSVLVRGGGKLSFLKPQAEYPGKLDDETQWQPAERLVNGLAAHDEVDNEGYALWVLPGHTSTRALRFTHTPQPGDRENAGWLGGVWVLPLRYGNVAPQALAQSVARDDASAKLVDEDSNKTWAAWQNSEQGAVHQVSREHPELIMLTWTKPVTLDALCLLWNGFADFEIEAFTGKADENVREASAERWQRVGGKSGMDSLYPLPLGPHWVPLDKTVQTRAVRLRITSGAKSGHPHLKDKVKEGRRVWLGEVLALTAMDRATSLASLVLPKITEEPPPIPINFTLPQAGVVTLVIEDQHGQRIRNLVSETPYPAGENIAWWDGSDDLLRDPEAAKHGVYNIPTRPVAPGIYKVRGIWHPPVKLHYEFSIYNAGKPAWTTADGTGGWMTNHTPPTSAAYVPGNKTSDGQPLIFLGAFISEGGHGLQWLREDGTKLGGQGWVGGTWTGAPTLGVDLGTKAVAEHLCYVASVWEGELRLTAKNKALADVAILKEKLGDDPPHKKAPKNAPPPPIKLDGFDGGDKLFVLGGIAARDGQVFCSMVRQNELLVIDIAGKKITSRVKLDNPRGLAFDAQGRLLALSGTKLVRYAKLENPPEDLQVAGLEDPRHVTVDRHGNFLITDRGSSHRVKVFTPFGKHLSTIGYPGKPEAGKYNPRHMNNPNGLAVDSQGRVWVTEADDYPRRVSLWTAEGELLRAFYGPTEYGGGGTLDPFDKNRFYYKGLEFELNWEKGTDQLTRVFARPNPLLHAHYGHFSPDTPLYPPALKGERYFTSCYTHNPTGGDNIVFLWKDEKKEAQLVAALGNAHSWPVLSEQEFLSRWPAGTKPTVEHPKPEEQAAFAWGDINGDGRPQPEEVQFQKQRIGGVTVMNDLSIVAAQFGERNVLWKPRDLEHAKPHPHYDLAQATDLGPAGGRSPSSGGNQSLTDASGWTITTNAPEPYSPYGLGGKFNGQPRWSYPSAWPGLHASHEAAVPDRPGMVIGHTRLLGGMVNSPVGPLFGINANMGNMYLMTADGLFVATLFHDIRTRANWAAPVATRNMEVTDVSLHDENFWPSMTQTADGKLYVVDGARTSLVRVDGLEQLKRLPESEVQVTEGDLQKARDWFAAAELRRQQQRGSGTLRVAQRQQGPKVDGNLADWPTSTDWAAVDRRGTKANFNSDSKPYEVHAALSVSETQLFAAWRTTEKNLLHNSGETPNALFKHGGCLDLMLATDPDAKPERATAGAGDQRLLITLIKNQPRALLYRAKVPGTKEPVSFSSPWRSVTIDEVRDVTNQLEFAADGNGNFEIALPLETLQWRPQAGVTYRGDVGVLRGSNGQTTQRVYWANKATAITADVPSEAELTPRLWGKWKIEVGE
jgi:hypothetical protein